MLQRSPTLTLVALGAAAMLASGGANATRTPVPHVLGIDTNPFSATVKWRVANPARVVLELGVDERYGIWFPTTVTQAALTGRTTLTGLEPATTYRYRVVAGGETA